MCSSRISLAAAGFPVVGQGAAEEACGVDSCVKSARPAIIVPLIAESVPELVLAAQRASGQADIVEWRIDLCLDLCSDLGDIAISETGELDANLADSLRETISRLQESSKCPVLATVRTVPQGGQADCSEAVYEVLVTELAKTAELVDVEIGHAAAKEIIEQAHKLGALVVASSHDFTSTPTVAQMKATIESMHNCGADVAKIAVMPETQQDVLDILQVGVDLSTRIPVLLVAMGKLGAVVRLCGGVFGSVATFASLGEEVSAPGQIDIQQVYAVLQLLHK